MLNTVSVATYTTPVVFKTLFAHYWRKARKVTHGESTDTAHDDILFDQAFHIVKAFINFATQNTLEDLQSFTNTHVPNPLGCAVFPVLIPMDSCDHAAKLLIDRLGNEVNDVAGGSKWWQVRGLDGIEAEWLATKHDQSRSNKRGKKHSGELDEYPAAFDDLRRVMLYIHGGGFSWGSLNTHRYQMARFARKHHGRVFSVSYRKAPGYPWPCPLQDALAAYLYLTQPPKSAPHSPVPPSRIVLAGDSAGAGICVAMLTVIRDMGMEQPRGAVLISPWVDLTHSMPSVMNNTSSDIIPQYGFIHKPSPLWGDDLHEPTPVDESYAESSEPATCNERKVDLDAGPAVIRGQIQQYATNRQLLHPLVSPLFNGSLGNLCPLYIVCGDKEVLRDETTYLAHRAADPTRYQLRDELMQSEHQQWQAREFIEPTQVHLQILDDFCHVPTVFSFTPAARYVYQTAGEFVKHVIDAEPGSNPFPPTQSGGELKEAHEKSAGYFSSDGEIKAETAHSPPESPGTGEGSAHHGHEMRVNPDQDALTSPSMAAKHLTVKDEPQLERKVSEEVKRRPNIVRERLNFSAHVRSIEDDSELSTLSISRDEIGLMKAGPVQRWLTGQAIWKKKYRHVLHDVNKRRRKYENKSAKLIVKMQKLKILDEAGKPIRYGSGQQHLITIFDLEGESPPPYAIAARRDNALSMALVKAELRRCLLEAPDDVRSKVWDVLPTRRAVPKNFPQQPPAEQQTSPSKLPVHGLSMWMSLMTYFLSINIKRARKAAGKLLHATGIDTLRISIESKEETHAAAVTSQNGA